MKLTDEQIIEIRDNLLPSQGEQFDCVAFARAIEDAVAKESAHIEAELENLLNNVIPYLEAEIERLAPIASRAGVLEKEVESLSKGLRIRIPTNAMEQEIAAHVRTATAPLKVKIEELERLASHAGILRAQEEHNKMIAALEAEKSDLRAKLTRLEQWAVEGEALFKKEKSGLFALGEWWGRLRSLTSH